MRNSTITANFQRHQDTTRNGLVAYESADASCSSRKEKTITSFIRTREVELENKMLAKMLAKQLSRGNPFDDKSNRNKEMLQGSSSYKSVTLVQNDTPRHVHDRFKKNSKILSIAKSKENNKNIMAENRRLYFKLTNV